MPLNIANARLHWRVKQNAKKEYFEVCDRRQAVGLIPSPPTTPFAKASIASVMRLGSRMDTDNAMARHKWPLDWLQTRGYIANDKDLQWEGFPVQAIKRGHSRLEITLTEIQPHV